MATVLITGGTGLIGNALTRALIQKGYDIIILTRKLPSLSDAATKISYALWDVAAQTIDAKAIAAADYIVHLAGANVADGRWTEKRKKEIADSRVQSGALLVKALKRTPNKVKAVISASAIGWYGPDPQVPNLQPFTEDHAADKDFLGNTCKLWEESLLPLTDMDKRITWLRTGIALSNEGGAYTEFKKPLKFGIASVLGSGRQVVSWIHIEDLVRLYIYAIENEIISGPYNAVAPQPVSNEELILAIAKERGSFFIQAPVPAFVLKAMLGEMSIEVLKSATVSSAKIEAAGFLFLFPDIKSAVHALEKKQPVG